MLRKTVLAFAIVLATFAASPTHINAEDARCRTHTESIADGNADARPDGRSRVAQRRTDDCGRPTRRDRGLG